MAERFSVRGTITDARQQPVAGVTVRAYDKDLPSLNRDQLLGEATTNDEGDYEIAFDEAAFRANERERADLYIVVDREQGQLGRSRTHFNPEPEMRIDLQLETTVDTRRSEYEQLVALLLPLVEPMSLAQLSADDVDFLFADTRADRRRIAWLAASFTLANKTGVPPEAFYGWARQELPREWNEVPDVGEATALAGLLEKILARLRATAADTLGEALVAAIDKNIIPGAVRERIAQLLRHLIRSSYTTHRAVVRLRDDESGAPVADAAVRVTDLDAAQGPEEIAREQTNGEGLFAIAFGTAPGVRERTDRRLRFEALDDGDEAVWTTEVRVAADRQDVLELRMPPRRSAEPLTHALDQLGATAHIHLPPTLLPFLAGKNIHSLRDLRRAGGLARIDGLPLAIDDPVARMLDAHADLARISPDVTVNGTLIDKGFHSVAEIAATPLPQFLRSVHESVGDFRAATIQVAARAQTAFLKNVLTGLAVDRANGFAKPAGDAGADPVAAGGAADPLPERCGCDDCEAAVSPAAYLADLIGYALTHLKAGGAATDLAFLEQTFHQPFGELPTDCEAVEEQVRQA